jgi:hypothetical protein
MSDRNEAGPCNPAILGEDTRVLVGVRDDSAPLANYEALDHQRRTWRAGENVE